MNIDVIYKISVRLFRRLFSVFLICILPLRQKLFSIAKLLLQVNSLSTALSIPLSFLKII